MNELFNLILDLENAGVLFGLISVILTVRESIFSWYFGIINVILFGILFYNSKIYGQMILQIFFLFVSIYGLYKWKYGGKNGLELESRNISQLEQIISFFFILLLSGLIFIAINFVSSKEKFSFLDAIITAISFIAQFLQARKVLESWILWIVVDILSIFLFYQSSLYKVGFFYFILLILATTGYFTWKRKMKSA